MWLTTQKWQSHQSLQRLNFDLMYGFRVSRLLQDVIWMTRGQRSRPQGSSRSGTKCTITTNGWSQDRYTCWQYARSNCIRNRALMDIRLRPCISTPIATYGPYGPPWPHVTSSIKPEVHRNAVRGGPSHGHRQSAQQISRRSVQQFQRCLPEHTDTCTYRQTDKLIVILPSPTGVE